MTSLIILLWLVPAQALPVAHAQTDSTSASVETSVQASDADKELETRLQNIYNSISAFEGVDATVTAGVVRLTGSIRDADTRARAEALAAEMPGVFYVLNDLETDAALETRVSPAIESIQSQTEKLIAFLPVIAIALLVLILFWVFARLAGRLDRPLARLGVPPMLRTLIGRLVSVVVFLIGLVLALDILGVTALVGTVLGAAGVVGIAIGFAFQDIVENYLAGVLMSIRRPFSLNDHLRIGDVEGKVLSLTSRELLLMTLDGNHVSLPNATVFKGTIYNFTRNPKRRFDFNVGVGVNEDLEAVADLGLATLNAIPGVLDKPAPAMIVNELGDSSVVVTFFAWVDQHQADFGKVRSAAIRLVKVSFDEAGISMPEPTFNIRMETARAETAARPGIRPAEAIVRKAKTADTEVETDLDAQIQEDQDLSDERNLLRE